MKDKPGGNDIIDRFVVRNGENFWDIFLQLFMLRRRSCVLKMDGDVAGFFCGCPIGPNGAGVVLMPKAEI